MTISAIGPLISGLAVDTGATSHPQHLMQRIQALLEAESDSHAGPAPEDPDPAELGREFARQLFHNEFLMLMLFGDEEKLGGKPEPWE